MKKEKEKRRSPSTTAPAGPQVEFVGSASTVFLFALAAAAATAAALCYAHWPASFSASHMCECGPWWQAGAPFARAGQSNAALACTLPVLCVVRFRFGFVNVVFAGPAMA